MTRIGLVGVGKIARDQHVPAIAGSDRFTLVATASPEAGLDDVPNHPSLSALIEADPSIQAVAICTPPRARFGLAREAIAAGLHVLLEKPPAATLSEVGALVEQAERAGVTLFAAWHSREAAGVANARAWLRQRAIEAGRLRWREDIRRWHPGQEWILGAGGYGIFDPGINAFSILTAILPDPVLMVDADLDVPAGRAAPIAARLTLHTGGATIAGDLDFRQTGQQTWSIELDTDRGRLALTDGGRVLTLPGGEAQVGRDREYPNLYARFADLIDQGTSDVDVAPLRLVADALLIGRPHLVDPFVF